MLLRQRICEYRSSTQLWSIICAVLCVLTPALSAAPQAIPQALLSATSHEFGIVKQGTRVGQVFTVRNEGTASLTLELLQLTQPGMTAKFKPQVAPAAEGTIRLEWNTAQVKGPVEGIAILRLNDPLRREVRFVLKGTVQPPIEFQPFAAVFLSAFRGETLERAVKIINNEDRPLKILGLEPSSDYFTARVETVEAGKTYDLRVSTKPDAPFGRVQQQLSLRTDHPEQDRLRVLVNVLIKPDVYANPETIDFGQVQLADLSGRPRLLDLLTQTFLVKTRRGDMQLKSVRSDLDFLDIKQSPPEGKAGAFRVDVGLVQQRLRPGPISGVIRIVTDDPRFPKIAVPVRGEIR